MHITARNPVSASKDDVPAATLAKETEIARDQTVNDRRTRASRQHHREDHRRQMKTWLARTFFWSSRS